MTLVERPPDLTPFLKSMIFSENRFPLFGIMLSMREPALVPGPRITTIARAGIGVKKHSAQKRSRAKCQSPGFNI
jgi:hypothetical protein